MKYVLKFELKEPFFKTDYRRVFISFFKHSLTNYMQGEFYEQMYESGSERKDLVWAIKFPGLKFDGEKIKLKESKLEMTLKFNDPKTALIYFSSMLEMKGKEYPVGFDNHMKLTSIRMVKENVVNANIAEFKIQSPICLRKHNKESNEDKYFSVEDEDFGKIFNLKLREDFPDMQEEVDKLLFNFEKLKKVVVKAFGIYIDATIGSFIVQGDVRLLNEINLRGVGSRRNSGFGLVESIPLEVEYDNQ